MLSHIWDPRVSDWTKIVQMKAQNEWILFTRFVNFPSCALLLSWLVPFVCICMCLTVSRSAVCLALTFGALAVYLHLQQTCRPFRNACGRGQHLAQRLVLQPHLCLPAIVRSSCLEMRRKKWFMRALTITSVWAAVAPTLLFLPWNRLKPKGTDSASVFICGDPNWMLTVDQ